MADDACNAEKISKEKKRERERDSRGAGMPKYKGKFETRDVLV